MNPGNHTSQSEDAPEDVRMALGLRFSRLASLGEQLKATNTDKGVPILACEHSDCFYVRWENETWRQCAKEWDVRP